MAMSTHIQNSKCGNFCSEATAWSLRTLHQRKFKNSVYGIWVTIVSRVSTHPPFLVILWFTFTVFSRVSAHGRLKFTGQKTGVGVYTEKPFVRITHIHTDHKIIKKRGWALTRRRALTRENTVYTLHIQMASPCECPHPFFAREFQTPIGTHSGHHNTCTRTSTYRSHFPFTLPATLL